MLVAYLHRCANAGKLAALDRADLADTINGLGDWRTTHDVADADPRPLGERPTDRREQAQYDAIANRYLDDVSIDDARSRGAGIAI